MRLASIYIHKHEFLFDEPQTVNFGGEYIYNFSIREKKLILERSINPDFIEAFWGDKISLVSSIVGANGSGKINISVEIIKHLNSIHIDYNKNIDEIYNLFILEDNGRTILKAKSLYTKIDEMTVGEKYEIPIDIINRRSQLYFKELNFNENLVEINYENMLEDNSFQRPYYFNLSSHFYQKLNISYQLEALHSIPFLSDEILISKLEETLGEINFIKSFKIETNELGFNFKSIEGYIYNNINPKEIISDSNLEELLKRGYKVNDKYFFFKYLDSIFLEQNSETGFYDLNGEIFQNRKKIKDKFFDYSCQLIARIFFKVVSENFSLYQVLCQKFIKKINYETLRTKENFMRVLDFIMPIISAEKELIDFVKKIKLLVELTPENLILKLNPENLQVNNKYIKTYIEITNKINLPTIVSTDAFDDADYINKSFLVFKPTNNISDGERNLIKLFSAIHNNRDNIFDLLILDEPELGFHPL